MSIDDLLEEKNNLEQQILEVIKQKPFNYQLLGELHTEYTKNHVAISNYVGEYNND